MVRPYYFAYIAQVGAMSVNSLIRFECGRLYFRNRQNIVIEIRIVSFESFKCD